MSEALLSWGHYPRHPQTASVPHWRGEVAPRMAALAGRHGTLLPFGNGRSYGDSCLATSDQVLQMRRLDRLIAADWHSGLITAEAGLTLEALLGLAIPRGWFLPVTPGTRFVTLGGALANDVHGKNHHVRGTFGCHVRRFGLVRSDRPAMVCSPHDNPEFFAATIGGLGLTGVVDWLELQLMPIRSSLMEVTELRFGALDEFFALCAEHDGQHEYTVAWIDCLSTGRSCGRGVYMAGDHAQDGPLQLAGRSRLNLPFTPPASTVNRWSLQLFNAAYFHAHSDGRRRMSYESFFYPLDRVLNWNRMYGPQGFEQYQCAIPDSQARPALRELLGAVAAAHSGSFLAVLKRFGNKPSPGLLSFPMPGVTLALDFAQQGEKTRTLMTRLDSMVRAAGGRLYPAKDAHMQASDFQRSYPHWARCEQLRDPVLNSRFWHRSTAA
jgi:FAD/FMN-containing dehydrogenase